MSSVAAVRACRDQLESGEPPSDWKPDDETPQRKSGGSGAGAAETGAGPPTSGSVSAAASITTHHRRKIPTGSILADSTELHRDSRDSVSFRDMGDSSLTGTTLADYRIGRLLGRGGMGEVYEAVDERLGRTVALKVLSGPVAHDAAFRERFLRESRAAARINSPHAVTIHNVGEVDGRLYLDMQLIDGEDLQDLLHRTGPLEPRRTLALLEQIAEAVDTAHESGLVHRDIKPGNILIDRRGRAYLGDFGLAQAVGDTRLTGTGSAIGSFPYMAPERFGADPTGPAVDVYALACVLYECLSGRYPFAGGSIEQYIAAHLYQPPPALGAPLDAVIARGMAKLPEDRYPTAGAMIADARAVLDGRPSTPPLPPPPQDPPVQPHLISGPSATVRDFDTFTSGPVGSPAPQAGSGRGMLIGAGAVAAVAIVALAAVLGWSLGNRDDPATQPVARSGETAVTAAPTPSASPESRTTVPSPTPTSPSPQVEASAPVTAPPAPATGDLGLTVPMSRPACDGSAILIVASANDPSQYAGEVQRMLNRYPGTSYVRTDQACTSLRQRMDTGELIYAIYYPTGGSSLDAACALAADRGISGANAKYLDNHTDPGDYRPC